MELYEKINHHSEGNLFVNVSFDKTSCKKNIHVTNEETLDPYAQEYPVKRGEKA